MKITKRQLRRIIKEEKARILREQRDPRLVQLFMKIGDPIRNEVETLLWDSIGAGAEDIASDVIKAVNTAINDIVMPHLKADVIAENRGSRLTLWVRATPSGNDLELYVNESGEAYNFGDYVYDNDLDGLMKDFEADHGMPIPAGTIAVDYEGMGMGDLPIEKMFQAVAEEYGAL
tara:strand:+ start:547 stop:1071 length:525 start_codon:yes stop_codon:yes gene_type:complete